MQKVKSNKISGVIIAKNSEKTILRAIKSLEFCDEILVVDDFSDDLTKIIAKTTGAKVIKRKLNNDFSDQRNFALTKSKNDWVLFIDSDEYISDKLKNEVLSEMNNPTCDGYIFRRVDTFLGKEMKGTELSRASLLRMGNKHKGKWHGKVHEVWKINNTKILTNYLNHYSHQNISSFIEKIAYYSKLHAEEKIRNKREASEINILFFPIFKFINNFIFLSGFLDNERGFIASIIMSFHSFLSWSHLWMLQRK